MAKLKRVRSNLKRVKSDLKPIKSSLRTSGLRLASSNPVAFHGKAFRYPVVHHPKVPMQRMPRMSPDGKTSTVFKGVR